MERERREKKGPTTPPSVIPAPYSDAPPSYPPPASYPPGMMPPPYNGGGPPPISMQPPPMQKPPPTPQPLEAVISLLIDGLTHLPSTPPPPEPLKMSTNDLTSLVVCPITTSVHTCVSLNCIAYWIYSEPICYATISR